MSNYTMDTIIIHSCDTRKIRLKLLAAIEATEQPNIAIISERVLTCSSSHPSCPYSPGLTLADVKSYLDDMWTQTAVDLVLHGERH